MLSNKLVVAALGFACITAAAGGGYLASRQNTSDTLAAAPAASTAPVTPAPAAVTPERPVQETEALVGDTASKPVSGSSTPASLSNAKATTKRPELEPPSRTSAREARPSPSPRRTPPPPLASTWPSSAGSQPSAAQPPASTPPPATDNAAASARPDERATQEPVRAPEPPQKTFEELVVSPDSVIGLQIENRISSETARIEERVDAHVTRDVKVGDRVAIPAGSKVTGSVMQVDRGGKFKERARLGIRFTQIVLADGTRVPISTETIYRDGDPPGNASAAKVGGAAVGGAILGAILGGAKGAAIGGTAGAGAGTAAVIASDRNAAVLTPGTQMTVRVLSPVTVTIEK